MRLLLAVFRKVSVYSYLLL